MRARAPCALQPPSYISTPEPGPLIPAVRAPSRRCGFVSPLVSPKCSDTNRPRRSPASACWCRTPSRTWWISAAAWTPCCGPSWQTWPRTSRRWGGTSRSGRGTSASERRNKLDAYVDVCGFRRVQLMSVLLKGTFCVCRLWSGEERVGHQFFFVIIKRDDKYVLAHFPQPADAKRFGAKFTLRTRALENTTVAVLACVCCRREPCVM